MKKYACLFIAMMFLIIEASCSYALNIFNINTPILSDAQVGKHASYRFTVTDMGGKSTAGVDWSMSGSVPGMSFSNATATLSGTPTREGTYSFTIRAARRYSTNYTPASDTRTCTLRVKPKTTNDDGSGSGGSSGGNDNTGDALTIIVKFPETLSEGDAYSGYAYVTGGTPPYKWERYLNDSLPQGTKLTCSDSATIAGTGMKGQYAHITGTAEIPEYFILSLLVTDSKGNWALSDACKTMINVNTKVDQTLSDMELLSMLENGRTEEYYFSTLYIKGGTRPLTYTLVDGKLPDGLEAKLNSDLRYFSLSGTPTKAGMYNFTLRFEDAEGKRLEQQFNIRIDPSTTEQDQTYSNLKVNGTFKNGKTGTYYREIVSVSGRVSYYSIVDGDLPDGLSLVPSYNELGLGGTPTKAGTYNFTIKFQGKGENIEEDFTVTIEPSTSNPNTDSGSTTEPEATLSTLKIDGTLGNGKIGTYYSESVSISGGTTPYTYTITNGDLPDGLEIHTYAYLGEFSLEGTPTKAGTYNFTVRIKDSKGNVVEQVFTIRIDADSTQIVTPEPGQDSENTQTNNISSSGGGGGGCDSGLGLLGLAALGISLTFTRKD